MIRSSSFSSSSSTSAITVLVFLTFIFQQIRQITAGNGELFGEKGQKNYEDEEEGKIIPHRYVSRQNGQNSDGAKCRRDKIQTDEMHMNAQI